MANLVLNTPHSVDLAKNRLDKAFQKTINDGELFQFVLKPFKKPKTHKQLGTIRMLCIQLSANDSEEWSRNDKDWWYRYYKLRAYVPLLEQQAIEDKDADLIDLIDKARKLLIKHKTMKFVGEDEDYSLEHFIADNSAFSYKSASKEHLIQVIDFMLNDAPKKGIFLEIKKSDYDG